MTALRALTDEEFLALAECGQDDLTSTAIEGEFIRRFRALVSAAQVGADALSLQADHGVELWQIEELLAILKDADEMQPKALSADLKLAKEFRALADEAGDLFSKLHQLISKE